MSHLFQPSPLPLGFLLLWLAAPGIWLGAGALTQMLPLDRLARRLLQPAVALAAWIVCVQLASRAAGSFWVGLPVGMIGLSAAGLTLWWLRRREPAASPAESESTATPAQSAAPASSPHFSRGMWIGMLVVMLPIGVAGFRGHFADVLLPNGHMSFTAQLQNNYFPPRYMGFKDVPLRYHYGFDLVCASLTSLTRLRTDLVIDLATLFGWAYFWCLAWALGERITGSKAGGLWTAIATLWGGGWVALLIPFTGGRRWVDRLQGTYSLDTHIEVNPPIVSAIFQHPFSLGLPLAIAILLLAIEPPPDRSARQGRARLLLLGLLLAALSMTQAILFITLAATLAFTEIVVARRWGFAAVLGVVAVAAVAMGGMFIHVPGGQSLGLGMRFWLASIDVPHPALRLLEWHLATYGALVPLGIWGLWHVRHLRIALALLAGGSLLVPLCIGYEHTWDIVKFATVGQLALGILSGATLTWLAAGQTASRRLAHVACLLLLTASPVLYLGTILWIQFVSHEKHQYIDGPVALSADDQQAVTWLHTHATADELVYRRPEVALGYMQIGGISSTPAEIRNTAQWGITADRDASRNALVGKLPPNLDAYRDQGIVYFVVGPDDPPMEQNIRQWERSGQVAEVKTFGNLRIYKLTDR